MNWELCSDRKRAVRESFRMPTEFIARMPESSRTA